MERKRTEEASFWDVSVDWSSGVNEWSSGVVEWSSGVVEWSSVDIADIKICILCLKIQMSDLTSFQQKSVKSHAVKNLLKVKVLSFFSKMKNFLFC